MGVGAATARQGTDYLNLDQPSLPAHEYVLESVVLRLTRGIHPGILRLHSKSRTVWAQLHRYHPVLFLFGDGIPQRPLAHHTDSIEGKCLRTPIAHLLPTVSERLNYVLRPRPGDPYFRQRISAFWGMRICPETSQ